MAKLFGTDGVRGRANETLTAQLALDLAIAAARALPTSSGRPRAVIGRDPRISGDFLQAAVVAGLASAGVDVDRLGVLPTPGVAYLTAAENADLGVMISASHNAAPDNGIKFFGAGGVKLSDVQEAEIQRLIESGEHILDLPTGAGVGRVEDHRDPIDMYGDHLLSAVPDQALQGLRLVVDCAEGAASEVGPDVLRRAGADVVVIHASPDGVNINHECGSTHLGPLQAMVVAEGADAGFAFDGDADRCLAVDGAGQIVDGDQMLAVLSLALKDEGRLANDTVVATVMSNLGFINAMRDAGVTVKQTAVGDRYVLEEMLASGDVLGGEQSGHIIQSEFASTGDGVLSALTVAARMAATGKSLADLAAVMTQLPQVLVNVSDVDKTRCGTDQELLAAVRTEEEELGDHGRVLLRPSGTESLVRVMVEAPTGERATEVAERLAEVVRARLG